MSEFVCVCMCVCVCVCLCHYALFHVSINMKSVE